MPQCQDSIVVKGDKKKIYETFVDCEKFVNWAENVVSVNIVERKENSVIVDWKTEVDGRKISWTEEDFPMPDKDRLEWTGIKGDLKKMDGFWQVEDNGDGTNILTLMVDFDLGIPMISALLHPILAKKVHLNNKQLLEGIKQKIENDG